MTSRRGIKRRALFAELALALGVAWLGQACRASSEERCKQCGMKVAAASPWKAEVVLSDGRTLAFDTVQCALAYLRSSGPAQLRVQEYYRRRLVDGREVRFVRGSDIVGPMGPEIVPVMPDEVDTFRKTHGGSEVFRVDGSGP